MMWDFLAAWIELVAMGGIIFMCLFVTIGVPVMTFLWGRVLYDYIKGNR